MEPRVATIGPGTVVYLTAYQDICNLESFTADLPTFDVPGILYSTMIQAGVDAFQTSGSKTSLTPRSAFLQNRLSAAPEAAFLRANRVVHPVFAPFMQPSDKVIWQIESFLAELLFALECGCSMICTEIPELDEAESALPPDLFCTVSNLFSRFERESIQTPLPKTTVARADLHKLQAILTSDYFATYVASQRQLEDGSRNRTEAHREIGRCAAVIRQLFPTLVKMKDATVSLLPVTAKVVDTVFGKLPGVAAEAFGKALSKWIRDDRRIVLYETVPFFQPLVMRRIEEMVEKKGEAETEAEPVAPPDKE